MTQIATEDFNCALSAHTKKSVDYPYTLHGVSELGEYTLNILKEKDLLNINPNETEYFKRIMQRILSHTADTICIDTLQSIWNAELKEQHIECPTALRLDCHLNSSPYTLITADTLTKAHSFHYLGSHFEYAIHSYIQVSFLALFIRSISTYNLYIIAGYIIILLFFIYVKMYLRKKRIQEAQMKERLMKNVEIKSHEEAQRKIEEEKQKRIEFEKEKMTSEILHYFSDDILYNKNTHILSVCGKEIKLRTQLALLFALFIESENYEISSQEIMDKVWPNGTGNYEKCRKLIYDLRQAIPGKHFQIKKGNQGNSKLYFIKEWNDAKSLISSK